jgi:multicomponent Na+:H+ antiporter subunit E
MILFADHQQLGRRLLRRSLELAAIWLVLTGARPEALLPGLVVVLSAAVATLLLPPGGSWRWRPLALARFFPYFLGRSLVAGFDVARRAFSPDPALQPGLVEFAWGLPPGPARVFLANVISLLPGTLSVGISPENLQIHTLNHNPGLTLELRRLETMVDRLFKQEAAAPAAAGGMEGEPR